MKCVPIAANKSIARVQHIIFYVSLCLIPGILNHYSALAGTDEAGAFLKNIKTPVPPYQHSAAAPQTLLIGVGDSLTQGTMNATVNSTNTLNAYLQKIAESLSRVTAVTFVQPLFDNNEKRQMPFSVPTNLGVDGADLFSVEGIEYYERAGASRSFVNPDYLCTKLLPWSLQGSYDKVLYPINLLSHHSVSQIDAAIWLLNESPAAADRDTAMILFWVGNNDTSTAALGYGGANPEFWPIPLDQIAPEIKPELNTLLNIAQDLGLVSFSPYAMENIKRNMTELQDFTAQYYHLLSRLKSAALSDTGQAELFLLTLPYYCSTGYLFDSEDLEYYLRKISDDYTVPATFKRVAEPGQPITDPVKGDRVSLLTFGFMYMLLNSGYSVDYVNQVLEADGTQRDGLVLSVEEQRFIMDRIDSFNAVIKDAAAEYGPAAHLIDIGQYLNDALTGKTAITINNRKITRKWVRGGGFSMDGVHPGYTGHALIANYILEGMNEVADRAAPLYDLSAIMQHDPYSDRDGDGWAPGPAYEGTGFTEFLFMFKDPDDADPAAQPSLPADVWQRISDFFLQKIL
jgi:lysophospholipase L1-like esterase